MQPLTNSIIVASWLISLAYASYPVSIDTEQLIPFVGAAASFIRDHTLYSIGGETRSAKTNAFFTAISLNTDGNIMYQNLDSTGPPAISYSRANLLPDGNTVILLGGNLPANANSTQQINNSTASLVAYQYKFDTQSWSAAPRSGDAVPPNRVMHSATLANGKVYIYGGAAESFNGTMYNDFWSYDPSTGVYVNLTQATQPYLYGHTAVALPDNTILYSFGVTYHAGMDRSDLLAANISYIYNTSDNTWRTQIIKFTNKGVSTRSSANAVLGPDGRYVYFFGGDSAQSLQYRQYLGDVAILDTKDWVFAPPAVIPGQLPRRRSTAVAGVITDNYIIFGFGTATSMYWNDLNMLHLPSVDSSGKFDLSQLRWVQNVTTGQITEGREADSSIAKGVIAAIVIVCVFAAAMALFLVWRFRHRVRRLVVRVHHDFWKPRTGEPLWAETLRLVSKIILIFLFAAFFAFVLIQVLNSPKATFTVNLPSSTVNVPNVRFCFTGYTNTGVSCLTDSGLTCSQYFDPLDLSRHTPFFITDFGDLTCYLFHAPTTFRLASNVDPQVNNGSKILFNLFGSQVNAEANVHVQLYPPTRDPNMRYFFNDTSQDLNDADMADWLNNDGNDFTTTNILDVDPGTYSTMMYQMQENLYLKDVGWNYVGFSPSYNSTAELVTTFRQEKPSLDTSTASSLGQINAIYMNPTSYNVIQQREQKIYSLINGIGFVGGLFGLFVAFQALMFGFRPRSPWGIVHRWSVGDMKRSIAYGLRSRFNRLHTPVPLVNPVHRRFSVLNVKSYGPDYDDSDDSDDLSDVDGQDIISPTEDDRSRLSHVEERMQLLELIFKSYYVDDEVFRHLDRALKKSDTDLKRPRAGRHIKRGTGKSAWRRQPDSLDDSDNASNSSSVESRKNWSILPFLGSRSQSASNQKNAGILPTTRGDNSLSDRDMEEAIPRSPTMSLPPAIPYAERLNRGEQP